MSSNAKDLNKLIEADIDKVVNSSRSKITPTEGAHIASKVEKTVRAVAEHNANQEPWYQSRVTWGAIIAVAAGVAGIAGYTFEEEDQTQLVNGIVGGISVVGGLITWYGRWRAKKPIGR